MHLRNLALAGLVACAFTGCDDDDDAQPLFLLLPQTTEVTRELPEDTVLQILHVADGEAGVPAIQDLPRFSGVLEALRRTRPGATLTLGSGDNWIPGVFYNAGGDSSLSDELDKWGQGNAGRSAAAGRIDIACMNLMGFMASCFGNHEFDNGTDAIATIIKPDIRSGNQRRWDGAWFPYLATNLDFSTDGSLAGLTTTDYQEIEFGGQLTGKIAGSVIVRIGEQKVGLIGATTPQLDRISSPGSVGVNPASETDYAALAALIQAQADGLRTRGIQIVVVLAHMQQIDIELNRLAPLLSGVDVIIAGGSNTLLADGDDILRSDETQETFGSYPQWRTGTDGNPIAVVNTPGNWRYVGRLTLTFNPDGVIKTDEHDSAESGVYATDDDGLNRLGAAGMIHPGVAEIVGALGEVVEAKTGNVAGYATVYLNGLRGSVRTQETNLGSLSADANLWKARQAMADDTILVSIKNGGGIRDAIGSFSTGDDPQPQPPANNQVTQLDIENSLRFNNKLTVMDVTRAELVRIIEHGFAGSAIGSTPGQFPQLSGVRVEWDITGTAQVLNEETGAVVTAGTRVRNLTIVNHLGDGSTLDTLVVDGVFQGNADTLVRIVTLNFLAGGGDGYPFNVYGENINDLPESGEGFDNEAGEQQALYDYLQAAHPDTSPFATADQGDATLDSRIIPLTAIASN